jgi:hypothetical protein
VAPIAIAIVFILIVLLLACVLLERQGYRQDTYRSVYGNHPDNPYNKVRKSL